jgi:hypothetical protein
MLVTITSIVAQREAPSKSFGSQTLRPANIRRKKANPYEIRTMINTSK